MSRTIELPDDVYARVEEAASASGSSVAEAIAARFAAPSSQSCPPASANGSEEPTVNNAGDPPRTLADEFAGLVGLISSGRTTLSERTGEQFAEGLWEKYQRDQAAARASQTGESNSSDVGQHGGVKRAGSGKTPRTLAELAEGLVGQVAGRGPHDLARHHSKYMGEYLEEDRRTEP